MRQPIPFLRLVLLALLAVALAAPLPAAAQGRRKVIIDQDAFGGPGLQPILMLLQDPSVDVLGITIESGDGWAPEETAQTLRMLELVHRTDVPVIEGAVFPLINSKARTQAREKLYGKAPYKGAWTVHWPSDNTMKRRKAHGPFVIPSSPLGSPTHKALPGSATDFLLRMTRKYPGQVSIIAAGPMTNLALAQRLDPGFARRVKELVVEGGDFLTGNIAGKQDQFAMQTVYNPRVAFNFWWDPEAGHIVLTSPWKKLVLVANDADHGIIGTRALLDKATASGKPVARYVKRIAQPGFPLWDEVEVAAWLEPDLVTSKATMAMDVDLMPGANYGALLTWPPGKGPGLGERNVEVVFRLDKARMEKLFVDLLDR